MSDACAGIVLQKVDLIDARAASGWRTAWGRRRRRLGRRLNGLVVQHGADRAAARRLVMASTIASERAPGSVYV